MYVDYHERLVVCKFSMLKIYMSMLLHSFIKEKVHCSMILYISKVKNSVQFIISSILKHWHNNRIVESLRLRDHL